MPPVTTLAELYQIQTDYFSFLTVRHPLERILSAYRDKFFSLSEVRSEKKKAAKFYQLYGRKIISQHRVRPELDPKYFNSTFLTVIIFSPVKVCEGTDILRVCLLPAGDCRGGL